jgi:hypothetical protein
LAFLRVRNVSFCQRQCHQEWTAATTGSCDIGHAVFPDVAASPHFAPGVHGYQRRRPPRALPVDRPVLLARCWIADRTGCGDCQWDCRHPGSGLSGSSESPLHSSIWDHVSASFKRAPHVSPRLPQSAWLNRISRRKH